MNEYLVAAPAAPEAPITFLMLRTLRKAVAMCSPALRSTVTSAP